VTENHTEQTAIAVQAVQTAVAGIDKIREGLVALEKEHPKDLVIDGSTTAGMKSLIAARAAWRDPRVAVEKARKEAKAPVLALGREIDAYAAELTDQLRIGEENYDAQIKKIEEAKAAERAERERIERENRQRQLDRVIGIRAVPASLIGASVDEIDTATTVLLEDDLSDLDEVYLPDARQARDKAIEDLQVMRAQRAEADALAAELRQLQAEREAREAELAEQRQREAEAQAAREAEEAQRKAAEAAAHAAELAAERERAAALQRQLDEQAAEQKRREDAETAERARIAQEAAEAEAARERAEAEERAQREREAQEQAIQQASVWEAMSEALALLESLGHGKSVPARKLRSAMDRGDGAV
jgi:colicin import membrane protein